MSSRKVGFTISGLNETLHGIDSLIRDFGQTKQKILTEAATFYKNDAVANAHVITGKTKGSVKIESISDKEAIITAGFGMPFEEKRSGVKVSSKKMFTVGSTGVSTPHKTMTEAAKKTTKEMPSIIDKHMNQLLKRHSAKL